MVGVIVKLPKATGGYQVGQLGGSKVFSCFQGNELGLTLGAVVVFDLMLLPTTNKWASIVSVVLTPEDALAAKGKDVPMIDPYTGVLV